MSHIHIPYLRAFKWGTVWSCTQWVSKIWQVKVETSTFIISIWPVIFLIPFVVQDQTVPHLKALEYGKGGSRGFSYGSTFSICHDILKIENLLHNWGFVESQSSSIVSLYIYMLHPSQILKFWIGMIIFPQKRSKAIKKICESRPFLISEAPEHIRT